jgi:hypothetical protein
MGWKIWRRSSPVAVKFGLEQILGKPVSDQEMAEASRWPKEPCGGMRYDIEKGVMYACGEKLGDNGPHYQYWLAHLDGKAVKGCKCEACKLRK